MALPSSSSDVHDLKLMLPNPGGLLALEHVLYRDEYIAYLWSVLARQSVRIESERRGGKSSILRKMAANPPAKWLTLYLDCSKVYSPDEFVKVLLHGLMGHRGFWNKSWHGLKWALHSVSSFKLAGYEFGFTGKAAPDAWKGKLERLVNHLLRKHPDSKLVLFLDEITSMLPNISNSPEYGPLQAMMILDALTTLRKTEPTGSRLRMVFAGSVGLHHVLRALKNEGHNNNAVNDMFPEPLGPLRPEDAAALAETLMTNSGLKVPDMAAAKTAVASGTGGFPFYIHSVIDRLAKDGTAATPAATDAVIVKFLTDSHDPWNLGHFLSRIDSYYPGEGPAARAILDRMAETDGSLAAGELTSSAAGKPADEARGLIELLVKDHYLDQNTDGTYRFRFPILRRWWRLKRNK